MFGLRSRQILQPNLVRKQAEEVEFAESIFVRACGDDDLVQPLIQVQFQQILEELQQPGIVFCVEWHILNDPEQIVQDDAALGAPLGIFKCRDEIGLFLAEGHLVEVVAGDELYEREVKLFGIERGQRSLP